MWLQIESVQTPAHNHTGQLSSAQGLVLRSAHYERIFLNAFHIPSLFAPPQQQHVALISMGFLWRVVCKVRS